MYCGYCFCHSLARLVKKVVTLLSFVHMLSDTCVVCAGRADRAAWATPLLGKVASPALATAAAPAVSACLRENSGAFGSGNRA